METLSQIIHYFLNLFNPEGFPPRWFCGNWDAFTGWFYIISDIGIWSAYYTIPLLLVYFVGKRKDVPFQRVFLLFAAFILACGSTHFLDALMFWLPVYRLSGLVLFVTAVISWLTIVALVPVIPQALSLKSPKELQREIDERKKVEEALRASEAEQRNIALKLRSYANRLEHANKELESFSYSVSHDLRTPLRSIQSFSQIILQQDGDHLSDKGRQYFEYLIQNSEKMSHLIDALLDLSRLSRSEPQVEAVDLSAMAKAAAKLLQEQEPERHAEFVIQEGVMAKGDPRLLQFVFLNLLGNAWKFTSKTPNARIEFGVNGYDEGDKVYYVRDNGAGFDMQYTGKLFGAFQRLHRETEFPGTGIGLASAQRIITAHGGKIWAEGKLNEGATFYFTLHPVQKAELQIP